MIRLEKLTWDNYDDVLKLKVAKEQKEYMVPNAECLIQAFFAMTESKAQVFPFGIYSGNLIYESFCGKDIDKIGFLADGRESVCVWREGKPQEVIFPWKTIVIDTDLLRNDSSGRKRFTIAHEIAHYLIDILITRERKAYAHREYDAELHNSREKLLDVLGMPENRADRLAAALIMPKFNIDKAMERYADNKKFTIYGRTQRPDGFA